MQSMLAVRNRRTTTTNSYNNAIAAAGAAEKIEKQIVIGETVDLQNECGRPGVLVV